MTDEPDTNPSIDAATDRHEGMPPLDAALPVPPEQAPMDDAAGGPDADRSDADAGQTVEETSTDDLFVQGGA